jgi:hypothetical protein
VSTGDRVEGWRQFQEQGVEGERVGGQLQLVDFLQMIGICIEELVC